MVRGRAETNAYPGIRSSCKTGETSRSFWERCMRGCRSVSLRRFDSPTSHRWHSSRVQNFSARVVGPLSNPEAGTAGSCDVPSMRPFFAPYRDLDVGEYRCIEMRSHAYTMLPKMRAQANSGSRHPTRDHEHGISGSPWRSTERNAVRDCFS